MDPLRVRNNGSSPYVVGQSGQAVRISSLVIGCCRRVFRAIAQCIGRWSKKQNSRSPEHLFFFYLGNEDSVCPHKKREFGD